MTTVELAVSHSNIQSVSKQKTVTSKHRICVYCLNFTNFRSLSNSRSFRSRSREIKVQNKNCLKTYFQLSTSTVVSKWEKEVTKQNLLKSLKVKLKLNVKQRKIFDEWLHTSNYVYNKTVSCINDGEPINFMNLRNKLVTANTKKNNIEYINHENNMRFFKEEKKKQLSLLQKLTKDDIGYRKRRKCSKEYTYERNSDLSILKSFPVLFVT
jgi:hypothetical protein